MSHGLGMKVVAECTEELAQIEWLKSKGCNIVQGYYYSKALRFDDLLKYIANFSDETTLEN